MVHNIQTKLWEKGVIAKVHPEQKAHDIQMNGAVYHRIEEHLKPNQSKPNVLILQDKPENKETAHITTT